jgi:hypothetical protein
VETLFPATFRFAALKKYAEKFDEWFGLGWRLASPAVVDVALTLKFAWQKDEVMEAAVKRLPTTGAED